MRRIVVGFMGIVSTSLVSQESEPLHRLIKRAECPAVPPALITRKPCAGTAGIPNERRCLERDCCFIPGALVKWCFEPTVVTTTTTTTTTTKAPTENTKTANFGPTVSAKTRGSNPTNTEVPQSAATPDEINGGISPVLIGMITMVGCLILFATASMIWKQIRKSKRRFNGKSTLMRINQNNGPAPLQEGNLKLHDNWLTSEDTPQSPPPVAAQVGQTTSNALVRPLPPSQMEMAPQGLYSPGGSYYPPSNSIQVENAGLPSHYGYAVYSQTQSQPNGSQTGYNPAGNTFNNYYAEYQYQPNYNDKRQI